MKETIQDIKDKMMQKNNIKKLILTCVLLFLGCELAMDVIYPLYIYNKTNNQYIAYYITAGGKYGSYYPDTLLPDSNIYIGELILKNIFLQIAGENGEIFLKSYLKIRFLYLSSILIL